MLIGIIAFAVGIWAGKWQRKRTTWPIDVEDGSWKLQSNEDILIMRQDIEDKRIYKNYEYQRLRYDRARVDNEWTKTLQFIAGDPKLLKYVTDIEIQNTAEQYDKYRSHCIRLNIEPFLAPNEFVIKEQHLHMCGDFTMFLLNNDGIYAIHHEPTAKYAGGNISSMIRTEYAEKWY